MAAISATISRIAALLGEEEEQPHELSIDMLPEDSCLSFHSVGKTACARSRGLASSARETPSMKCAGQLEHVPLDLLRRKSFPDAVLI